VFSKTCSVRPSNGGDHAFERAFETGIRSRPCLTAVYGFTIRAVIIGVGPGHHSGDDDGYARVTELRNKRPNYSPLSARDQPCNRDTVRDRNVEPICSAAFERSFQGDSPS